MKYPDRVLLLFYRPHYLKLRHWKKSFWNRISLLYLNIGIPLSVGGIVYKIWWLEINYIKDFKLKISSILFGSIKHKCRLFDRKVFYILGVHQTTLIWASYVICLKLFQRNYVCVSFNEGIQGFNIRYDEIIKCKIGKGCFLLGIALCASVESHFNIWKIIFKIIYEIYLSAIDIY